MLTAQVEELQKSALKSFDRFQPATDSEIQNHFAGLVQAVKEMSNLLGKRMQTSLSEDDWRVAVTAAMCPLSYDSSLGDFKDDERKLVITNIIWHFLKMHILGEEFGGHFGEAAEFSRMALRNLFPEPRKSSFEHGA